jgi:uridine kinase
MYEKYVEPSKKYAQILVPEGGKKAVALDLVVNLIEKHIEGRF